MIPSWARKGVKVVCVDFRPGGGGESCPMAPDAIYTIDAIETKSFGVFVFLKEVEFVLQGRSLPFGIFRFRPVVDDSDEAIQRDVALFTSHLKQGLRVPTTVGERSDA
jgi:hypothetical protein